MAKNKKVRVELRKNRAKPPRCNDVTVDFQTDSDASGDALSGERVRAKGNLSRHRTMVVESADDTRTGKVGDLAGRVLRVHGLYSYVELEEGQVIRCTVRRLLKSLSGDERSVVTTGDRVWIRLQPGIGAESGIGYRVSSVAEFTPGIGLSASVHVPSVDSSSDTRYPKPDNRVSPDTRYPIPDTRPQEGTIERVEPRRGVLTRASRRKEHALVANVDQVAIVVSLVQPDLKLHLIDRYLATAEKGELAPILCLNKADLVDVVEYQPLIGAYSQLGIPTILCSAKSGFGLDRLRKLLSGRATVFSGQSGVGKSSLLNAIQPELALRVKSVSQSTDKGKHTTTAAELIRLDFGGWVVDTPGVRQLQLWDTRPEEVEGLFREFRPLVALCAFPDCTHIHERKCAVLAAVERKQISERRYFSYLGLFRGVDEE